MEKIGYTLVLLVGLLFFFMGAKMAIKVADPYTRRASASLADALSSI